MELERPGDWEFQLATWKWQRVGWAVCSLFLFACCLGFFGTGPFSSATVEQGRLTLDYARFQRFSREADVTLSVRSASDSTARVAVPVSTFQHFQLTRTMPIADRTEACGQNVCFVYTVRAGEPYVVRFELLPQQVGYLRQHWLVDGEIVDFGIWVLP